MGKIKSYQLLEVKNIMGWCWVFRMRVEHYLTVGMPYFYCEVIAVDHEDKYEVGFFDETDARAWLVKIEKELEEVNGNADGD